MCCNPFVYMYLYYSMHTFSSVFLSLCDFCFVVVVLFVQFKLDLSNKSSVIEVGPARDSGADVKRLEFITMLRAKGQRERDRWILDLLIYEEDGFHKLSQDSHASVLTRAHETSHCKTLTPV